MAGQSVFEFVHQVLLNYFITYFKLLLLSSIHISTLCCEIVLNSQYFSLQNWLRAPCLWLTCKMQFISTKQYLLFCLYNQTLFITVIEFYFDARSYRTYYHVYKIGLNKQHLVWDHSLRCH